MYKEEGKQKKTNKTKYNRNYDKEQQKKKKLESKDKKDQSKCKYSLSDIKEEQVSENDMGIYLYLKKIRKIYSAGGIRIRSR